ncbi:hypothetical protein CTAYLR_005879 [Chrysophaeum taylorii]|uniref:UvrD-like helicase ATP-binding domain-containing protein n=1 Tax=Chrysophaeum taylorii TaxID=2483200 RepID=A0AAD7UJV4_9STRA|nr:hypothetical protein CTAYLR_005879 [Chrysophaeum taylorii]
MELQPHTLQLLVRGDFSEQKCGFRLSAEEKTLVETEGNLLVLARSGTGKTNVLLERALWRETRARELLDEGVAQIFITASPRLSTSLKEMFDSRFSSSSSSSSSSGILEFWKIIIALHASAFGRECEFATSNFHSFWRTFDDKLTRKFSEQLVRSEIVSTIKGRRETLENREPWLSRETYVEIVRQSRRADELSEADALSVYRLFEAYEKAKRGALDTNDVAHKLFRHFFRDDDDDDNNRPSLPEKYDFVYVDEVQDLTPVQLALLRVLAKDTKVGLSFAGDSAQTISGVSTFRFEALKDLFYHVFFAATDDGFSRRQKSARAQDVDQRLQNALSNPRARE